MPAFPVRSAAALMDTAFDARWRERERIGSDARRALRAVMRHFLDVGGPVAVDTLSDDTGLGAARGRRAVQELDAADCVLVRDDRVVLAYPFATAPTGFVTVLPGGAERHACCAIDALGIAALARAPATVRARCHDCGAPLELALEVDGPRDATGAMAWVGERDALRARALDGL